MTAPTHSPWGPPQDINEIAPGIFTIATGTHGGMYLTPERAAQMPTGLQGLTWLGKSNWFEEDQDWAWVPLRFPEAFEQPVVDAAYNSILVYIQWKRDTHYSGHDPKQADQMQAIFDAMPGVIQRRARTA